MAAADLLAQLHDSLGDRYALEGELGGGGMSRVFVAEERALERKVAIKVLAPELAEGISGERFAREVKLAARLQHPNVVPLLTAGEAGGHPYYAMPLVAGQSLRARLDRGDRFSIREATAILRDVARALAYAHEEGIVHRDIKPENILLSGEAAVVADFGIAKAVRACCELMNEMMLTQVGTSLGTPAYMAPEQAAGDPDADHRTDIYAWGVVAYEMLAGAHPFTARTPHEMVRAHMTETPRQLRERRSDVPASLAAIVEQCLAKDPGARPASATDLLRALDDVADAPAPAAAPPAARDTIRPILAALALALALAIAVAVQVVSR